MPISIIKNFATCYCEKLASIFNDCLKENKFPNLMKIDEISPAFKKLDNTSKDNYRPISTLSSFTKLFERILFTQLNRYMQIKFSKYLTGFWKNHNTQNFLIRMIKSWKFRLNKTATSKHKACGLDSNSVTFM